MICILLLTRFSAFARQDINFLGLAPRTPTTLYTALVLLYCCCVSARKTVYFFSFSLLVVLFLAVSSTAVNPIDDRYDYHRCQCIPGTVCMVFLHHGWRNGVSEGAHHIIHAVYTIHNVEKHAIFNFSIFQFFRFQRKFTVNIMERK